MYSFYHGNVSAVYASWPMPDLIVSDGAYGIRGFRGDTACASDLLEWYHPHCLSWAKAAKPSSSLWFWNTEVGWATVHPLLLATGWEYVQLTIWDKGLAHIAGNVNGQTIRQFPVVTEVAALYRRKIYLKTGDGKTLDAPGRSCRKSAVCGMRATRTAAGRGPRFPKRACRRLYR